MSSVSIRGIFNHFTRSNLYYASYNCLFFCLQAGCRRCNCDPTGSEVTDWCDPATGQCRCKPGVAGLTCDICLDNHYDFHSNGCRSCDCHEGGSIHPQCDPEGRCMCRPRVLGRQCDQCEYGFWNVNSGSGCDSRCECDPMGARNPEECDPVDGQCECKSGVGGLKCDACLVGFWGFSPSGCVRCEPCTRPGRVCDPDTGRCVCPPRTIGHSCQLCQEGAWDYDPYRGCKACGCHPEGRVSDVCDASDGHCRCLEGFRGPKCDECDEGFYNFPKCRPCNCHPGGALNAQCDANGACRCKEHAVGRKCAGCRLGTFGLSKANAKGCFECFCFGRSDSCSQGRHVWTQLALPKAKSVELTRGNSQLNASRGLLIIPEEVDKIGVESVFTTPLYWRLPDIFLGDKLTSYNGFLRFSTRSNGKRPLAMDVGDAFPLVQIVGNFRVVLEHFPKKISTSGRYEVRLREDFWVERGKSRPTTRETLMTALQKVQEILIRFSDTAEVTRASLEVTYSTLIYIY